MSHITKPDDSQHVTLIPGAAGATMRATSAMASVLIGDRLAQWGEKASAWDPAQRCRGRTEDFARRMSEKRRRLGMPIIVALLGGTGTGKSSLVNSLLGQKVVQSGNVRPTTNQPTLICRPGCCLFGVPNSRPDAGHSDTAPFSDWGIDTNAIKVVTCDSPVLDRLVLLDCPDPDTTEDETDLASNLAKLRNAIPYCDVLLVTATQQKYRDHDVLDELALAAPGARLIFVQTHAGRDDDIRSDWATVLEKKYNTGKIYFVDSLAALARQERGEELCSGKCSNNQSTTRKLVPNGALADASCSDENVLDGDFAELYSLLTAELSEETAIRIREANYVDRAEMVISQCRKDLRQHWPGIEKLDAEVQAERRKLGEKLSEKMCQELRQDRRLWESQLISETSSRWWFSPFSIILRLYLMLCDIAGFLAAFRHRSVMGLALGKAADVMLPHRDSDSKLQERLQTSGFRLQEETTNPEAHRAVDRSTGTKPEAWSPLAHINGLVCWDMIELQKSALSLPGFLSQANLPEELCTREIIVREANDAGRYFIAGLSGKVHEVCGKLAKRPATQWLRIVFEVILSAFIIAALYRPAKSFFYETWTSTAVQYFGFEYYLTAFLLGAVISVILLTIFLHLLRRGLDDQIRATVDELVREFVTDSLFVEIRREIRQLERFRDELDALSAETQILNETAGDLDARLGKRKIVQ